MSDPENTAERIHDRDGDGLLEVSDITSDQFWQAILVINSVSREQPADHLIQTSDVLNDLMSRAAK